jgi:MFS family permease
MIGIVKVGTGTAIMILPPLAAWLIDLYGWRDTYAFIGIALFVCVVAGAQLMRRDPGQKQPSHEAGNPQDTPYYPPLETGLDLEQAMKTRRFWLLCLAYFTIFFCSHSLIVHIANHTHDLRLPDNFGALVLSIIGGASIAGRIIMGVASDRIGSKRALIICFVMLVAALTWLQFTREIAAFVIFGLVYGFAHGGFYVLNSTAVADFFGTRAHGLILGTLIFSGSLGGSIGPFVTGRIFDVTGSYQIAFILLLTLAVAGLVMISSAEPPGPEISQRA